MTMTARPQYPARGALRGLWSLARTARAIRAGAAVSLALALAGCVQSAAPIAPMPIDVAQPSGSGALLSPDAAARNFVTVVSRVEPIAEQMCRQRTRGMPCDFRIVVDDRPGQPPNAFQTLDESGQPVLGFTLALIADARNADEIAFVVGHEASHHILGHLARQQRSAMTGAILGGIIAAATGADSSAVDAAQQMGATVGARGYSKDYELQADALGAEIALRAGYNAVRGAAFFDRLPDPGDRFLGSHPANSERKAVVQGVQNRLTGAGY